MIAGAGKVKGKRSVDNSLCSVYGAHSTVILEELMEIQEVTITIVPDTNVILGQAHFIKTVEDLYEVMVNSHASVKFGIAFCEAFF